MVEASIIRENSFNLKINFWVIGTWITSAILIAPILTLFITASGDSEGLWKHLFETVLAKYIYNTILLMLGVSILVLLIGVLSAWIISRYNFIGKKYFDWLLMLPIACPAYLVAYAYTDFFEYAGPIQGYLRNIFNWNSAQDYWFPEIRSLGGAIFVMSFVLYPYVYVLARTAFIKSPSSFYEIASIYNKHQFYNVALPIARPAIFAGLALVCMEVISDFGTVEFFTVETLTLGIFNVWLGMNNLAAAAQISIIAFIFVISLIFIEIKSRSNKRFSNTSQNQRNMKSINLNFNAQILCILFCLTPSIIGFFLPVFLLISHALKTSYHQDWIEMIFIIRNTVFCSFFGALSIVIIGSLMALVSFYKGSRYLKNFVAIASTGYAFPGTMLSIGVLVFCGFFDKLFTLGSKYIFGLSQNGLISGTIIILLIAYIVRFQAVGFGAIRSGITQIPLNLMDASQSMGKSFKESLFVVIFPLLKTYVLAGGLLAFVDIMKELPMTILLRPFNFETLATYAYQFAHDELIEQAALPALLIIFAGLIPVIFLNKFLRESKF